MPDGAVWALESLICLRLGPVVCEAGGLGNCAANPHCHHSTRSPLIPCLLPANPPPPPCCSGAALGNETVLRVTQAEQEFVFEGVEAQPVPSLLRGFSGAPSGWRARLACWWPRKPALPALGHPQVHLYLLYLISRQS